ncbi:unnamed protein product [Acanthoscelides obtectus]|uniref:Protein sleepless n=1 Tax=Acanthoscelides obtectus TaxID=200917 RepID=A0A9P0JQD5_ACAOB|nr:unnamed protein product [Acanthoscelides obtectus]CAK1679255.1 hypothetical protein AOBTE_LOCUS32190 [Acanthoscelides obtectus]
MVSVRIALFLALAISVIAGISGTKCYLCSSLQDEKCRSAQNQDSYHLDCARFTPVSGQNYTCGKIEFVEGETIQVVRGCMISDITCEDIEKVAPVKITDCTICDTDFCNGA